MAGVNLSVRSELLKIIEDLDRIAKASGDVSEEMKKFGQGVGEEISRQTGETETMLGKIRSLSGRVAAQMRGDFKTLFSINALREGIKMSDQFRGTVREAFTLSDAIRKLGGIFGVTKSQFGSLQASMVRGMGEIGLSSETAARAIEGLSVSGTQVRGPQALLDYSRTAGQLASVTRQQGREGDIARAIAQVIQARGGDVNSMKEIAAVAEDVRRVFNATGAGAADTLQAMKTIFQGRGPKLDSFPPGTPRKVSDRPPGDGGARI